MLGKVEALGLTDTVAEDDGQQDGHGDGAESRAPPRAVLGRLLEFEGAARERVAGQGPCGGRIHRPRSHGVARSSRAEQRGRSCACLKEEVPEIETEGKERSGHESHYNINNKVLTVLQS